jgi:hypothetical protein
VAEHRWGGAAANQADRVTKNVIEAARWKNHDAWPQGMPGGFKGSHDGAWPSGQTATVFNGHSLLVVWTTAYFIDTLHIANRDIYLKRVVDGWPTVDDLPLKLVSGPTDEVNPVLASDGTGGTVLAWERQNPAGGVLVEYAFLREEADTQPPKIDYIQKLSDAKLIVGFDEPIAAASVKTDSVALDGATVKSVAYNSEGPAQGREIIIETEPLTVGKAYPVKITGIADTLGNATKGEPFAHVARPGTAQRTFFVDRWLTVGPWPTNYDADYVGVTTCRPSPGEAVKAREDEALIEDMKKVVPPDKYEELTKTPLETAVPKDFGGDKTWKVSTCRWMHCLLDFIDSGYGKKSFALAYAHNYIWSDQEREAVLRIDSQNGHRAWLNGQVVSDDTQTPKLTSRGLHDYTNEAEIRLKPGWNSLLVAVSSNIFRWRFVTQIVDKQGRPIRDLTWQLEKPGE